MLAFRLGKRSEKDLIIAETKKLRREKINYDINVANLNYVTALSVIQSRALLAKSFVVPSQIGPPD